ncbi:hypothetical protein Dimus_005974 [Dionaea muscipula]
MDHLMARRLVNLATSNDETHELCDLHEGSRVASRDWLTLVFKHSGVPLVIKKGEEPKKYDFFEDTFLTMCKPTVEDGIWWIGSVRIRRDDDEALQRKRRKGRRASDCKHQEDSSSPSFIFNFKQKIKNSQESTLGLTAEMPNFSSSSRLERKRANRFHDESRRPKPRMPNF